MKKLLYSALALVGVLAVSCNKETEAPETAPERTGKTHTVTLKAAFAEEGETRTAYANNKTFSWVAGDVVYVRCLNEETDYWYWAPFTADDSGAETTLTGEVDDGYEPYDVAVYVPGDEYVGSSSYNGSTVRVVAPISYHEDGYGLGTDSEGDTTPYWNSVSIAADSPLSRLPLVSVVKNDVFYFQTAMGALKVNMTGVSAEATHVRITSTEGCLGNYLMVQDGEIRMSEPWYDSDGNLKATSFAEYYFKPVSDGNVSFVIPMAVGSLPAGSTFTLLDENDNELYTKTVKNAITVARNKVTELVAFDAKADWKSVGTGKYCDFLIWNTAGWTSGEFVDVEIFQDATNPNVFRVANPYGTAATHFSYKPEGTVVPADEYLTLTITADDYVTYPYHNTGVYMATYGEGTTLLHPLPYFGYGRNIVAKYGADGIPANILLAPIYYWSNSGYWTEDNYVNSNTAIQILFPGADPVDLSAALAYVEIVDSTPAQAIALVNVEYSSAIASADLVIAANETDAFAAFAAGSAVKKTTKSGEYEVNLPANAPTGDYYVFMQTHVADGLTEAANQLIVSEKFYYVNENTDLGLDESVVFGSWSGPIVRYTNQDGYFSDTFTITFAESDDPFTGNVQITEVYGDEVTIPTYAFFDGKTGILSIPPDQPYANFTTGYDVGILNADSPTKPMEFRYTNEGQLYLQNCEFVEFLLYEEGTTTQTNYWWGYFYGDTSDYHVLLTKDDANPSPAAVSRPAQTKAPARVSGSLARIPSKNL